MCWFGSCCSSWGGVLGAGRGGGDTARTAEPATQGTFHTMSHHGQCVKLEEEEVKRGKFGVLVFDPIAAWRHLGRRNSAAVNLGQKRGCSPSKAGVNSTHPSVPLISSLRVPLGAHGTSLSGCAAAGRGWGWVRRLLVLSTPIVMLHLEVFPR